MSNSRSPGWASENEDAISAVQGRGRPRKKRKDGPSSNEIAEHAITLPCDGKGGLRRPGRCSLPAGVQAAQDVLSPPVRRRALLERGLDRRGDLTAAGVIARAASGPPAALPA